MMKKIIIPAFAVVIALGIIVLFSTALAAEGQVSAQEAIAKVEETIKASDPIAQKLKEIINEEIASFNVDDYEEPDMDEARAGLKELDGYTAKLDELLSGLKNLPGSKDTSDGKTVLAAREYLNMLRNMTSDLSELLGYGIDFYEAVIIMGSLDGDADDYALFAEQLWEVTGEAKESLERIKPPSYMAISHNDVILRIDEFHSFASDFYTAGMLEDPLRIMSCVYRMNRITRMFAICDENINADLELQLRQSERRLNGPVAVLYDELTRNIAILKKS